MSRRGGGRGKPSHKGRRRHFTDAEELKAQMERDQRQKEWRENRGEFESDEEGAGGAEAKAESSEDEESSEEEESSKPKGVSGLIEIENPNRVAAKMKKVKDLEDGEEVQLTRREREELARQRAKQREIKLQLEGKTDQAKADLARLALIRKQREEAAKKREADKKAKEDAAPAGRGRGGKR